MTVVLSMHAHKLCPGSHKVAAGGINTPLPFASSLLIFRQGLKLVRHN